MNNESRYRETFVEALNLTDSDNIPTLTYNSIPEWDSIGHMQLVAALEEAFDIMLEMDDILDMSSYEKGMEILGKYDVQF